MIKATDPIIFISSAVYLPTHCAFESNTNTKHPSRKKEFNFKIPKYILKTINNKLHTKIFRKKRDPQTFLNINSEHPKSLKNSIP